MVWVMNRMILIKTNTKHSIPQSSSFFFISSSLTTLAHLQKIWLINQTVSFFLPHLTGWSLKDKRHVNIVLYKVLQQNIAAKALIQARETIQLWQLDLQYPLKHLQSYEKLPRLFHSPTLPNVSYCNDMLKQSLYKERLIWCIFSLSFSDHISLKKIKCASSTAIMLPKQI